MSAYLDWHVGMKVVCVDADDAEELAVGHVYTVTKIGIGYGLFKGKDWAGVCLCLREALARREQGEPHDDGFNAARFRPVQTSKTDISIFHAMLTPKQVDA